jgi:putative DNA primase/helicase
MLDDLTVFLGAIRSAGLEPPETIEPGRLHRFPGANKGPGNRAGWCVLFDDGRGGRFGDWSTGLNETWRAKRQTLNSPAERTAFGPRARAAKAQMQSEEHARWVEAAERAHRIWAKAAPATDNHPYLVRKRIWPHGARAYRGALILPVVAPNGRIASVQFIDSSGDKRLLRGGRKVGCFIPVHHTQNPHNTQNYRRVVNIADYANCAQGDPRIVICEGWATGCTLAEDDPRALVLAAIDAGNLKSVALSIRSLCPAAQLMIAGDDDRLTPGNPGPTKAREAAIAADALLALPRWPEGAPETLTDFNDLAVWLAGGAA